MCVSNTEFEYGNFVDRSGNIKQNEHKKSNLNPKSKENLNQKTLVPQKTVNKIPSEKTEAKVIASQKKISGKAKSKRIDSKKALKNKNDKRFNVKSGLSDHTMGWIAPVVAATLGASMIEKHFIIDRNLGGVDSAFSMSKDEFKEMVQHVRDAEKCIGIVSYEPTESMISGRRAARSLYVAEDVKAGEVITKQNVRSVRPGYGLHPKYLPEVLGKKFAKDCDKGERFTLELVGD